MRIYTNFEDAAIGVAPPAGWTPRGAAASSPLNHEFAAKYGSPPVKERVGRYYQAVAQFPGMITFDAIDADANRANVEILVPVQRDQDAGATDAFVWGRVDATGANGYYACLRWADAASPNRVDIGKLTGGVHASVGNVPYALDAARAYWMRVRFNAGTQKVRVWPQGGLEPTAWTLETADELHTGAGHVGVSAYANGNAKAMEFNFFSVATNGDTAWKPRTNEEYTAWLADKTAKRRVIFDMEATGYDPTGGSGSPQTFTERFPVYIGNGGFMTKPWDDPPNQYYAPAIKRIPTFSRDMSAALSGLATTGLGAIEVGNPRLVASGPGVRDDWLRMKWIGDESSMYFGAPSWPKHDFRKILAARVQQPVAPALGRLTFAMKDFLDILSRPLQRSRYDASAPIEGMRKPIVAGAVRQAELVPISNADLLFQLNDGPLFVTAVLDNGVNLELQSHYRIFAANAGTDLLQVELNSAPGAAVEHGFRPYGRIQFVFGTPPAPLTNTQDYYVVEDGLTELSFKVSATPGGTPENLSGTTTGAIVTYIGWLIDGAAGTIRLAASPAGRITAIQLWDIESSAPADPARSLANLIERLIFGRYGLALDYKDQEAFDAHRDAFPDHAGITFYDEDVSALDALHALTSRAQCWYGMTPTGRLQIGRISLPDEPAMSFTESEVEGLTLEGVLLPADRETITVRHSHTYTWNGPLAYPMTPENATFLAPYLTVEPGSWDPPGVPLDDHPEIGETTDLPVAESAYYLHNAANAEFGRLEAFYARKLGRFKFRAGYKAMELSIGQTILLGHSRLGWKEYTTYDPQSPDNSAAFDARKAVVVGIDVDLNSTDAKPVTLRVLRQIPGHYPLVS